MIFVTVGHQMPFDRLVRAVDEWAGRNAGGGGGRRDVLAQLGDTPYRPSHIESVSRLSPEEFDRRLREAEMIVAHAGTGTIISAVRLGKPLLVMPRLSRLGETRNDHQVASARHFGDAGYVLVAQSESELPARMDELSHFRPRVTIGDAASPELIAHLREFIQRR